MTSQMLFVLTIHMRYPWQMSDGAAYRDMVQRSIFGYLLDKGYPVFYYLLIGLRTGMLAGVLVLLAVYLSTYLNSRIFMIAVPAIVYQLIRQILSIFVPAHKCLDILFIYGFYSRVFASDILSTLWTMTVSFLFSTLLVIGIYIRMKKKMLKLLRFILQSFRLQFVRKKTFVLFVLIFTLLEMYTFPIIRYSVEVDYSVSIWAFPFILSDIFFLFLFLCCILLL